MTTIGKTLLIALAAVALSPARAAGQFIAGAEMDQARAFAERALATYVSSAVHAENAPKLGFKSVDEAGTARLGDPMPVLFIGLTELKAYRAGAGPGTVLSNARTLWFPVLVQGEVRSKLEITEIRGKWTAGEFGRSGSAKELMQMKGELPKALEKARAAPDAKVALVRIPALDVEMFYATGPGGDTLVPVRGQGIPSRFEKGKPYPADELLVALAEAARPVQADRVR